MSDKQTLLRCCQRMSVEMPTVTHMETWCNKCNEAIWYPGTDTSLFDTALPICRECMAEVMAAAELAGIPCTRLDATATTAVEEKDERQNNQ